MDGRLFIDQRYPDELITESQLQQEYTAQSLENDELSGVTFEQYLFNCMESQGGTLSLAPRK